MKIEQSSKSKTNDLRPEIPGRLFSVVNRRTLHSRGHPKAPNGQLIIHLFGPSSPSPVFRRFAASIAVLRLSEICAVEEESPMRKAGTGPQDPNEERWRAMHAFTAVEFVS
ncbi:hypothetical protein, partial [Embleya sp. NPDC059259]|uniref:hypothetical protein n=1 Tax=Embleya sp. NPDC059259 TaxID=3346796 RepID=UPI0036A88C61